MFLVPNKPALLEPILIKLGAMNDYPIGPDVDGSFYAQCT